MHVCVCIKETLHTHHDQIISFHCLSFEKYYRRGERGYYDKSFVLGLPHTYIHTYTPTYIHTYTYIHIHIHIHTYIYICIHNAHTHACMHTYIPAYICTYMSNPHPTFRASRILLSIDTTASNCSWRLLPKPYERITSVPRSLQPRKSHRA